MPIAWHSSRWRDWCVPKDEKKETDKLWKQQIFVFGYLICFWINKSPSQGIFLPHPGPKIEIK